MTRRSLFACLALWALGGALAFPAEAATVITGTVKNKAGQPLPGLALLEKGELHNNVWARGALVAADGHFRIKLPEGGQYGLHVYSSGYIYSPQAVKVENGKAQQVNVVLVPEPTRANDPVIKQVSFGSRGKGTLVKMDVTHPNNILGPQVLAFNAATGKSYAMTPPHPMKDLKANFPNGVYQLEVADSASNPRKWYFVVADHQCNTSDILGFPHSPKEAKVIH